jgi:plastocyanin
MDWQRRAAVAAAALIVAAVAASSAAADQAVAIGDNTFTPGEVTIAPGETVTWTHQGIGTHSVTADDGSFDSSPSCPPTCLANGQTFRQTFSTAGTFRYHCRIHGGAGGEGMSGIVRVVAAATQPAPAQTTQPAPAGRLPTTGPSAVLPFAAGVVLILLGWSLPRLRRRGRGVPPTSPGSETRPPQSEGQR